MELDENTEILEVKKNTQTFVFKLAEMKEGAARNIVSVLNALKGQQQAESSMESSRAWRIMWEKALKEHVPYIMYFIYMGTAAGFAFANIGKIAETSLNVFFVTLGLMMLLPLACIFFITLKTINRKESSKIEETSSNNSKQRINGEFE